MRRTDLTIESVAMLETPKGIVQNVRGERFKTTEVLIQDEEGSRAVGRKVGKYITLESEDVCKPTDSFNAMAMELSQELGKLIPQGSVLVAGLGNDNVTPDTLGVLTAKGILATRHFRDELPKGSQLTTLREVSVVTTGVLGQTGIESAEVVKSLVDRVKPNCVVVIDAFACSDISRLGSTIQIADTGIHPGSGVNNSRKEISSETMGVPVLAVGVPTVVDMHTIVENLTGNAPKADTPNLMVTPKDIDTMVEYSSKLLAEAISMALHPQLYFE